MYFRLAQRIKLSLKQASTLLVMLAAFGTLVVPGLAPKDSLAQAAPPDHARLWQAYANKFISSDGRVLDPQNGGWTTSEGQSYAMFFALVNNDRPRFDKLVSWTTANLAQGDLGAHLPSWCWGKNKDGQWTTLDPNSAADSDLWIAYDLIEAGRLWNDLTFATTGRRLASLIARKEVTNLPGFGPALLPGAVGFRSPRSFLLNPSYTPIFILNRLAAVQPAGPWADVAAMVPILLERSSKNGFAMDWVSYTPGEGFTPSPPVGQKGAPAVGAYEAIRVYAWAGMLPDQSSAKMRILKALPGMNAYLQQPQHGSPPEKINSQGVPQPGDGPVGFSAAILPYLAAYGNQSALATQLLRIRLQLDEKTNLYGPGYGPGPGYYDQNLVLFGSGWMNKLFQFGSSGELLVGWSR